MNHQTAAMLVIGNEILSGRTREANAWLAAQKLFERGCRLTEISVVPDQAEAIIANVNRLRDGFDAVITSGGIGPTHDDITMQSIAAAFGVALIEHRHVVKLMEDHYGKDGMNDGRRRMTRVPEGSTLIRCSKTIAPGAHLENVYILAGVPDIFASQLESILADFGNLPMQRQELEVHLPESLFADQLAEIQSRHPNVEIGSYPGRCGANPYGKICVSSQDAEQMQLVASKIEAMLESICR